MAISTLVCEFLDMFQNKVFHTGSVGRQYHYLYNGSEAVSVDDYAVVHNGTHFGVCKILRVLPGISDKVLKPVITVLSKDVMTKYEETCQNIKDHRKIFDQLDNMLKEERQLERYRNLADRNPQARELFEQVSSFFNMDTPAKLPSDAPEALSPTVPHVGV